MSVARALCLASAIAPLVLFACTDYESAPSADAGTSDAGPEPLAPDASPARLCPLGCLPPAPPGWTGPSATFDGAGLQPAPACPPKYAQRELEAHEAVDDTRVDCTCTPSVKCRYGATLYAYTTIPCTTSTPKTPLDFANGECKAVEGVSATHVDFDGTAVPVGSCQAVSTAPLADATLTKSSTTACGLPQSAACDTRDDCVAAPDPAPFTRLCIHREGEQLCPSADYAVRKVVWRELHDTRACGCGPLTGSCGASPRIDHFYNATCAGVGEAPGTCTNLGEDGVSYFRATTTATGACPPNLTGDLMKTGAETFCCNK